MSYRVDRQLLLEIAGALDAMSVKELICDRLVDEHGGVCALGAVCLARKLDMSKVDQDGVVRCLGVRYATVHAVIAMNDLDNGESNAARWTRVRQWVAQQLETLVQP